MAAKRIKDHAKVTIKYHLVEFSDSESGVAYFSIVICKGCQIYPQTAC